MFYSKSTCGFYSKEIHGDNIPSDAIEISSEIYAGLMEGQALGKCIAPDADGNPILVDQPQPTEADRAASIRAARDALLKSCDWVVVRAAEASQQIPPAWIAYRQALRDVPEQAGFPLSVNWPVLPS